MFVGLCEVYTQGPDRQGVILVLLLLRSEVPKLSRLVLVRLLVRRQCGQFLVHLGVQTRGAKQGGRGT